MAKFAVLFIAALAFQAAVAGVLPSLYQSQSYDNQVGQYGAYQPGQLQGYVHQIQTVANELSAAFQYAQPNSVKTLTWQSREVAQAVEQIVDRLQAELNTHSGPVDRVLEQVFRELKEIQVSLYQTAGYVDTSSAYKLQYQLSAYVQDVAHQIEKLVYLVQYNAPEAQGSLYATVQYVLGQFLTAIQQIKSQAYPQDYQGGLYGQGVYQGEYYNYKYGQIGYPAGLFGHSGYSFRQAGKGLAIQLQVVASDLSAALQHVYVDNAVVRQTLMHLIHQYVQHLEVVVESLEQVSYTNGVEVMAQQQVTQNLRQIIASLQQVVHSGVSGNAYELKNQLIMYVQNIASELKKLTYGVQPELEQHVGVKLAVVRFLTATRYLYVQVQYISQVAHRGQTFTGFGYQIQTLTNGLTAALQTISVDNKQARQVLAEQSRELAQHIQNLIERIQSVSYSTPYGAQVPQQVATNLRHIVASLQQVADFENVASAYKLKMHFIASIQEAATEIQKLLWVGQGYLQQGQGEIYTTPVYAIFNDFVAALQNQQVQLQGLFHFSQYGQGTQQLAVQIQAFTNNLAIFLHNVPVRGEHARQVEIQAHRLAHNIENIIQRLEVEAQYTNEHGVFQQVVSHLRQIVASLEQVTVYEGSNSVYELSNQLNVVLQQVAAEMRKLAYVAQYDAAYTQGNFNNVVRSVLIQYLNVIQHVQLQLQGINQVVQIGQTPRELGLQIQVAAQRLAGMFHVVPDSRQTYGPLVFQARRFSQLLEIFVGKLHGEFAAGHGKAYYVFQQIANNLNQIQMSLHQAIANVEAVSPYQLKIHLAARIQEAAVEIQKLAFVAPYEVPQTQGEVYPLVKSVLIDFLAGLQHLQMQVQDNLQIVFYGQNPRALAIQIQSVAQRLSGYLQYVQPNSQQFRQILVIQIGELSQAIQHVVEMLQTEIKNNVENSAVLKQVAAEFNKIALALQQVNGVESHVPANELATELNLNIHRIVAEFHKLAYVAQYKVQQTEVGFYRTGVLNGVFNNVLGTLRNIFIQMQNIRYMGYYGQNAQQLVAQIDTVTNHLAQTLQLVGASSKTVKQALAIQTFRYAHHIQNIVEKLESEISYRSEINGQVFQQVVQNLRQVVVALQQIAGTWTTSTTTDLRTQLVAQIQHADAQIQKLAVAQTQAQQYQVYSNTIVKSVLIEYFAAVQNFNIRVHTIAHISQKGQTVYQLAIQIETAAIELSSFFQHVLPTNRLVGQTITVEARQFAKVIASIVNKLQSVSAAGNYEFVHQIASQLKQVQLSLEQIYGEQSFVNVHQQKIHLEANVHRAVVAIQQLIWAAQPEFQQIQVSTGIYAIVKEALVEFLAAVQNVQIQIQNVVHTGQTRQFAWGWGFQQQQDSEYPEQYYSGWRTWPWYKSATGYSYYGQSGKYSAGLGYLRGQIAQSPRQYLFLIQQVVDELYSTLQGSTFNTQQAKEIVAVQARYFAQIIENIVDQLEQHLTNGYENVDTTFQQVVYRLREVQQALRKIVGFTTFTNASQLKSELETYIQTAAAQIEKLVYLAQQAPQGNLYAVIKNVLSQFLNGVQYVQAQFQRAYHYGQYQQYGKKYGYAGQYDSEYGYAGQLAQYGKGYGYANQYNQYGDEYLSRPYGYTGEYGQYDSEYGYAGQYRPYGYGYAGKYDQYAAKYGYAGQYRPYVYGYGTVEQYNPYDDEYGYAGLYRPFQYGSAGVYRPYGYEYGFAAQYRPYGYGHAQQYDQYDNEYGYAGQYRPYGYGYAQQYDQYDNEYGYAGQYRPYGYGHAQQYDQYDNEYGYAGQYRPYGYGHAQQYDQYDNEYGYAGQYRPYGYGYAQQYDQYDSEYGYAGQYRPYGYGHAQQYDQYDTEYGYAGQYRPYGYGYAQQYDQYDNEYGYAGQFGQYGNKYGLYGKQHGLKYGYEGQPIRQLAKQVEIFAQQIAAQFQTVAANDQQVKQVIMYQARQLVQVIDNIVDRFQAESSQYGVAETAIYQVISSLREIQTELQQIVNSGVLATVYQIKAQFATYIEKVAAKLHKLALIAESDAQVEEQLVKSVLVQYLAYLRNVYYQAQSGSTYGQSWNKFAQYQGIRGDYAPEYYQDSIRGF